MSKESRRETMKTLWSMVLHRLGFVRLKHYDELAGQYARLTEQYVQLRHSVDRLADDAKWYGGDKKDANL